MTHRSLMLSDNFPTKDSSWYFVHLFFFQRNRIDERRFSLRSGEIPAVILSVSITIPRKVSRVDRPSGALMLSHSERIACRLSEHSIEPGEPAVKNLSK